MSAGLPLALALGSCAAGTLLGLTAPARRTSAILAWSGALAGAAAAWAGAAVLWSGRVFDLSLWGIASVGVLRLTLDRLSALFLLLAGIVLVASSVFSAGYMRRYADEYSLRSFTAWYLLLSAAIGWVLLAGDVLSFLFAWEIMSLACYLLVNFEHQRDGTPRAAYVMLVMSEAGFMLATLALLFLAVRAGSLDFSALRSAGHALGPGAHWFVFLAAFFGFAIKAGLVPLNTWLPLAHPAAPANVSAVLSSVILNLGLYGIVRVTLDLAPAGMVAAGLLVLAIGTISALVGILYATTESDLKVVLAHSSIENVGIVVAGIGAAMVFSGSGHALLAGMALVAAFYHMINHSVYKALLFLGAGAVNDRAGTRDLDRLGGLVRAMPWTAGAFLVGALAISALPPFNGFVSEWLTLQVFLRSAELAPVGVRIAFASCGAVLALTAALAVTCFARAFAMGFLGFARSDGAALATEAALSARAPIVGLAALCLALGVLPTYVVPALTRELSPLADASSGAALVPPFFVGSPGHDSLPASFVAEFHDLGAQVGQRLLPGPGLVLLHRGGAANPVVFAAAPGWLLVVLTALLALTFVIARAGPARRRTIARRTVWDGGIRRLLPEMTYTATGFSNPVRVIFQAIFRPTIVEDTRATVAEHFRTAIVHDTGTVHVVDRLVLRPARDLMLATARLLARMHHGRLNAYVAYALLSLLAALGAFALWR